VEEEGEEIAGSTIQDLRLQHNELRSLDGTLFLGMKELQRLNLSHNALGPTIGPRDLRGLDGLRVLDISHNQLTTLEDTSEVDIKIRIILSPFPFSLCSTCRISYTDRGLDLATVAGGAERVAQSSSHVVRSRFSWFPNALLGRC